MRQLNQSVHERERDHISPRILGRAVRSKIVALACILCFTLPTSSLLAADDANELPFKAVSIIFETTEDDIELQAFIDGNQWKTLKIEDTKGRKIFDLSTQRRLGRQGLSELLLASEPDHFPEEALAPSEEANEVVRAFFRKFPAGGYEFEGETVNGKELEGEATLTHILPALPEIVTPVSMTDKPPMVDRFNLEIIWDPVTTRFIGDGPVDIIEYQVILDQVEPQRTIPWIDGSARRGLINVPGTVTSLTVSPEYLLPDTLYDFEVLAIEASGNTTISVGEFMTMP